MSWRPATEPAERGCPAVPSLDKVIEARARDVDGLAVGRVLPAIGQRMVGPFAFFDHMGPASLPPGRGLDVRPHPHINLATVTYLFEGEIEHRDSLGSHQIIRPGEINWMTAGRGIAHSERTPAGARAAGPRAHGIQLWVALPRAHEETEPAFFHHAAGDLPEVQAPGGVPARVLVGEAYGVTSPVRTFSRMFYLEASLPAGAVLPVPDRYPQRAAYVVAGTIRCDDELVEARRMALFTEGAGAVVRAEGPCRVVLLGGDALDGPRYIWWNFVSSSQQRIEAAKRDWRDDREARFGRIPGDEVEYIPLPAK